MRWLWYSFLALFSIGMLGLMAGIGGAVYAISYFGRDLPDYRTLKDYEPPVVTRVYAGDGRLMAEFAQEKRVFVPVEVIPDLVKHAFIAAEDQNFYKHQGIDVFAIARAAVSNLSHGGRPKGASTITQQVAKNFFLTNEVSYARKIREAILAFRMERAMSKDRILELYLNEIYLGEGAYGVAAAALNYFGKPLEELTIPEAAFLAALPKAPNNYHPVRKHDAAVIRRDWVIDRMEEDGFLNRGQADLAKAAPLQTIADNEDNTVNAPYFAEEVRRELIDHYGSEGLYGGGMAVRTSVDPRLQAIAKRVLREGLVEYDRRRGYRGALGHFDDMAGWQGKLMAFEAPASKPADWRVAVVLEPKQSEADIGFADGTDGKLLLKYLTWTKTGIASTRDIFKKGDVIMVDKVEVDGQMVYGLRQIPKINGALVAMDPHTGRVLAMEGGWSYRDSEFNRATQAKRQPGSAFKPFVYLAALDKGFTPATLVLDAPIVIDQGPGMPKWRPTNYKNEFYGPTPIRVGVEKSRNLMTVRLADFIGMPTVVDYAEKFGVVHSMEPLLSYALGAGETTLLQLTTGYAQLVNGGKKITPTFIDRIQDRRGKTVFSYDSRPCNNCGGGKLLDWKNQPVPEIPDQREQIADPRTAYQIVSIMEGVVQRGTAVRAKELKRPLAGKTGTTNESKDTWFIGFSPDLVVGVFAGYDEPKTLGKRETGSSVALPIWIDFMEEALAGQPAVPFRVPPGIKHVQINADTGARAKPGDAHVIWEAFTAGTEPTDKTYILDGKGISLMPAGGISEGGNDLSATTGTGGLY